MDQELLYKYFNGLTTQAEEMQILDWVEASDDNQHRFQKERMLFDIALFSETEKKQNTSKQYILPILKWTAGIAASIIIVLSCGVLLREILHEDILQMQTVTVPAGQRAHIVLADGTTVWLNSQSTLTYHNNFGNKERNVTLNGEAFFDVTPNKKVPFFVNTQQNQIRVVGTKFNVCSYDNTNSFEAALVEGIIDVFDANNEATPIARLHKDDILVIADGIVMTERIESYDFLRWREGLYCFDDAPLNEVFDKLQKYYNVRIIVENSKLLDYRCTGKFKEKDGVDHILRVIQRDHKFTFKVDVDTNTITIY